MGRLTLSGLLAGLALVTAPASTLADGDDGQWRFDVYLDDREIGYHEFRAAPEAGGLRLTSEAKFEVKVLFITAFDYEHENTELWRDGCLQRIESRTRTKGKLFEVTGRRVDDRFDVQTRDGADSLADCVGTFAYWDRERLARQRLLNAQTGEYLEVDIQPLPSGTVRIEDMEIPVDRYKLSAKGMDITLAYETGTDNWVALDSTVKGGRLLRYRRHLGELAEPASMALGGRTDQSETLK